MMIEDDIADNPPVNLGARAAKSSTNGPVLMVFVRLMPKVNRLVQGSNKNLMRLAARLQAFGDLLACCVKQNQSNRRCLFTIQDERLSHGGQTVDPSHPIVN